jgi:Putative DNA-binding domain
MKAKTFYPEIYYVVQGRSLDDSNEYITHSFIEPNPLEARQRAFSYLEYYVQLLHQGKKIFFKEKDEIINDTVFLKNISSYDISFAENNIGLDGIAVYMVVNLGIISKKTENNVEKHLIYSIKNLNEENLENIKYNLIKEFIFYQKSNIDTVKEQVSIELKNEINSCYKILRTPTNFFFTALKTYESNSFNELIVKDFKVVDLLKTTFISKLDWHIINIHIASFLNTDGGRIYLGKFTKNKIINSFNESSIEKCTQLLKENIALHFPNHKNFLSFRFVKINNVLVPIIEICRLNRKFSFYNNQTNNNFYIRTKNGIKTMNETEKIVEYTFKNSVFRLSDLNEILDML